MVRLNAVVLNLHVRMMVLDIEQPLFQVELQLPLKDAFAILGNPDDMVLVRVGPMGTESDIHALNIQREACTSLFQPSAGNPFTHGLTPVVLRVIVDRAEDRKDPKDPEDLRCENGLMGPFYQAIDCFYHLHHKARLLRSVLLSKFYQFLHLSN